MAADLTIKRFDTYPPLQAQLTDLNGPIDLTTATSVKLLMKATGAVVTGNCTFVSRPTGQISYSWATNDLSVSGTYEVEFEITWPSGKQTVPNGGYNTIVVLDDLEDV